MKSSTMSHWRSPFWLGIAALALFLIFYHGTRIISGLGTLTGASPLEMPQLVLRGAIVFSLIGVLLRIKNALIAMWVSIGALVGLQIIFLAPEPWVFDASYLRGFIVPSLISLLSFFQGRRA